MHRSPFTKHTRAGLWSECAAMLPGCPRTLVARVTAPPDVGMFNHSNREGYADARAGARLLCG